MHFSARLGNSHERCPISQIRVTKLLGHVSSLCHRAKSKHAGQTKEERSVLLKLFKFKGVTCCHAIVCCRRESPSQISPISLRFEEAAAVEVINQRVRKQMKMTSLL